MSNPPGLRSLVDSLDDTLVTRHADLMAALNAILDGLGIPPPTATTTLADVQTTLLATNALLTSDLQTISGQLNQIYLLLANSIAPNVENVFFALNDLYMLQLASASPRQPALISTVNLPSASELLHCQRVQWMIDDFFVTWMGDIAIHLGALEGAAVAIAMAALVVGTAGIGAIPLAALSSGAYAIIQVQDLAALKNEATSAKRIALRQALYSAPNAAAAQAAWNATIDSFQDVNAAIRLAWRVLIWSDWFNHLYDAAGHNSTTEPGSWILSGYDGNVCNPTDTLPLSFVLPYNGINLNGSDYGTGPWPVKSFWTRSTDYCGTNNVITVLEALHFVITPINTSGSATVTQYNTGSGFNQTSIANSINLDISAGHTLHIICGNGSSDYTVTVSAGGGGGW